jgi:hypothetical protein
MKGAVWFSEIKIYYKLKMDTASLANRFRTSYFNQRVRRVDLDAHELELQNVIKTYFQKAVLSKLNIVNFKRN